jgi:hypothetical protein
MIQLRKTCRLSALVPKLLKHSSNNREMAYPYSIFEPTAGVPLSTIAIYLSLPERRSSTSKSASWLEHLLLSHLLLVDLVL